MHHREQAVLEWHGRRYQWLWPDFVPVSLLWCVIDRVRMAGLISGLTPPLLMPSFARFWCRTCGREGGRRSPQRPSRKQLVSICLMVACWVMLDKNTSWKVGVFSCRTLCEVGGSSKLTLCVFLDKKQHWPHLPLPLTSSRHSRTMFRVLHGLTTQSSTSLLLLSPFFLCCLLSPRSTFLSSKYVIVTLYLMNLFPHDKPDDKEVRSVKPKAQAATRKRMTAGKKTRKKEKWKTLKK